MSGPEPIRHKGRLEVPVKAQFLAYDTSKIVGNKNVFDPEMDERLIDRMKTCSEDIYIRAWQANKIRAETNRIDRITRYNLQGEAILLCDELHACIGIAKPVFHLRTRKVKYWSGLITEVRKLLQSWKESDVKRYGQP